MEMSLLLSHDRYPIANLHLFSAYSLEIDYSEVFRLIIRLFVYILAQNAEARHDSFIPYVFRIITIQFGAT
jgi:hypothetical protein